MLYGILTILALNLENMSSVSNALNFDAKSSFLFMNPVIHNNHKLLANHVIPTPHREIEGLARDQFQILNRDDHGLRGLVYFNNATTTQKPNSVLKAVNDYYTTHNFSVYRGSGTQHDHVSTEVYESARKKIAEFINAPSASEIIFTSGITESLNLVANTWGPVNLKRDDVILIPISEHNSNLLPWRVLCERIGCRIEHVKLLRNGRIDLEHLEALLRAKKPKLLSCGHASNVVGVIQDIATMARLAHANGCRILVDAAQTVGKVEVDVQELDIDFLGGSGHKMYGPTGVGFLYYRKPLMENLTPLKTGGGVVSDVTFESCEYIEAPFRFEAGTPPVAQAIGLAAAVDFLKGIGMDRVRAHHKQLLNYLYERINGLVTLYEFDITLDRLPIIAFNVDGVDPFDLCSLLATKNIITRAGKHCAALVHHAYYCTNTIRVSFALYNSSEEVDKFVEALKECIAILKT